MKLAEHVISIIATTGVLLVSLAAPAVHAENAQPVAGSGLSFRPAIVELAGQPGELLTGSLELATTTAIPLPIRLSLQPLAHQDTVVNERLGAVSAHSWAQLDTSELILQPNANQTIKLAFKIPQGIGGGGYYAMLTARVLALESGSLTTALPELRVPILLSIGGDATYEHIATNLNRQFILRGPNAGETTLRFRSENVGNIHALFRPSLSISGDNAAVVRSDEPLFLLPGESTEYDVSVPDDLPKGRFTLRLSYGLGPEQSLIESTVSYLIIMPFSPFLLLLIPLAGFVYVAWRYRRRLKAAAGVLLGADTDKASDQ